ncbi:FAD-linked oxidase C-terminal domain-containing protein [Bradyrhizobium sp. STM 3809]|uniref:FAD-linked oxidase C-terminal domain-containing protein n=1 Tax=Bradyrhizobium sp. STM 3809 TaxID=551936 RepID=UPI0002407091|nr:FAD-linked oxidase C-terminal domain-containing protein [Bradyrhizobium sp. STM 3809]CCD98268.1 putative D-lactate dehydrogenase, mitochondrial precursor (Lactate dehydrogenase D) (DLD) [Bradyrhizobium sp. STM 3809]
MHVRDGAGALAERLARLMGPRASVARGVLDQHGRSESYYPTLTPDIVVFPETTAEIVEIVRLCAGAGMPIVPFGAGTSLEGNAAAVAGGVCVDFARMTTVLAVHESDMDVVVQPGITRKQLNAQLRDTGLFFPIDPGADASIGGMSSTRASGTMAVRYGTMKDNVLALEMVLADGRVIRTSRRARKSAAGYDLTRLFVGAEGTLGIITEITLKLHPLPQAISAATCAFDQLGDAVDTAIALIQSAVPAARIELLDDVMMRGINAYSKLGHREAPTLFLEFHGSDAGVAEQAQAAEAIAREHGGRGFAWARAAEDRSRLWHARDNTLYAGLGLRPGARAVITDVCVPISRLAECLTETRRDADASGFIAPIVGHVGDGNFHMLILVDPASDAELAGAKALQGRMVARAIAMDGTCTGEHGIGLGKIAYLEDELGEAVSVMRSIKAALDPHGLMNPGKIFAGALP